MPPISSSNPPPWFEDYRPNPGKPGSWDESAEKNSHLDDTSRRATSCLFSVIIIGLLIAGLMILLGCSSQVTRRLPQPVPEPMPTAAVLPCTVVRVTDGDTIRVRCGTEMRSVRLIGIDAPETVHPSKPDQCYGAEASARMRALAAPGSPVTLVLDVSQGFTDRYDRTLAYVEVDGIDIGLEMIRGGYAVEYTYGETYDRRGTYLHEQRLAQARHYGLWTFCEGTR
jgi:endonuclease YncB( thermonuclease family)